MKLREYGLIMWKLAHSQTISQDEMGGIAWELKDLVEDWSVDNTGEVGHNVQWFWSDYRDYERFLAFKKQEDIDNELLKKDPTNLSIKDDV